MRFPIHLPDPAGDRRPPAVRLAALGTAVLLACAAALAVPQGARADELAPGDAVVAEASGAADAAATAPSDATAEGAVTDDPADAAASGAGAPDEADTLPAAPADEAAPPAPVGDEAATGSIGQTPSADAAPSEEMVVGGAQTLAPEQAADPDPGQADQPPIAVDDHYTMEQGTTLFVDGPGLVANDSDPEGDWLTVSEVFPFDGEFLPHADLSFTFTPAADFVGTRTYEYILAAAGRYSAPATITIDVLPAGSAVDHPPIVEDDVYLYAPNTPLYIDATVGVLANDTDGDGAKPAQVEVLWGPSKGTVALEADGSFLFEPVPNTSGSAWFRYRACDAILCATGEVWLHRVAAGQAPSGPSAPPAPGVPGDTLNHAPIAVDDTFETLQDTPIAIGDAGLLANDSDPDGDPLALASLMVPPSSGSVEIAPDGGSVTYTPDAGWTGSDLFQYLVTDGTAVDTAWVTVTTVAEPDPCATASEGPRDEAPRSDLVASAGAASYAVAVPIPECPAPDGPGTPGIPAETGAGEPGRPEQPAIPATTASAMPAATRDRLTSAALATTGTDALPITVLAALLAALGLVLTGRRAARR